MSSELQEYIRTLRVGDDLYYKLDGQIYKDKIEQVSPDWVAIERVAFNASNGVEIVANQDIPLSERAVVLISNRRVHETYDAHKKRRMTSSHVASIVRTGILDQLDHNCDNFLRICRKAFTDEDVAIITEDDRYETVSVVRDCILEGQLEDCSAAHVEFVARVLNEKAAIAYVRLVNQESKRRNAPPCGY